MEVLKIRDLQLAAALLSIGINIFGIERSGNYAMFLFDRTEDVEDAINDYHDDRLKVKARTFADSIRHLKSRLNEIGY